MATLYFVNQDVRAAWEAGDSLLQAARKAGIVVESPCNGLGTCGKCRVRVESAAAREALRCSGAAGKLPAQDAADGWLLACQTFVRDAADSAEIHVLVKNYAAENTSLKILSGGRTFDYERKPFITKVFEDGVTKVSGGGALLGEEAGDTSGEACGLAVDIGTTTLVAALVDLTTGKELATDSTLNPQTRFAQDVLSRIHHARDKAGLDALQDVFLEALDAQIGRLCAGAKAERRRIYEAVYSGNTTMLHLACGVDPTSLGQFPYTPKIRGGNHVAAPLRLGLSPLARVYLPPVISAYVGADIVSGVLISRLDQRRGKTLFIDVGTNGEMVLACDGKLAAASTAAGPAFEGMNITYGMRANNGALESFAIKFVSKDDGADAAVEYGVIGGGEAKGICGSGLLDIVGELARTGLVASNGRFAVPPAGSKYAALAGRFIERGGKKAFLVAGDIDTGVCLTQGDVRQVQLAKGAIRAGIEMLLSHLGIDAASVDTVEIAGSFGFHLRESSLLDTGLLPPQFAGKVAAVGNTSMSGAAAFLLNTDFRARMTALVARIDTVELARDPAFQDTFLKYLSFDDARRVPKEFV